MELKAAIDPSDQPKTGAANVSLVRDGRIIYHLLVVWLFIYMEIMRMMGQMHPHNHCGSIGLLPLSQPRMKLGNKASHSSPPPTEGSPDIYLKDLQGR